MNVIQMIGQIGVWADAPNTLGASVGKMEKTDYLRDLQWCQDMFTDLSLRGHCPVVYRDIPGDGAMRLFGNGSELVLLPNGHWFMNDTSGG